MCSLCARAMRRRNAPTPSDLARWDCAAERRGRGRSDFAPRMRGAWRGEERAHGAEPPPPSGAEPKQRGGITPPTGQASDERAEGEGGRGEGTGDNTPATRPRAQRTAKKRLPEHLSAAAETSGLDGREARTGAEASAASRSAATRQNAPSLLRVGGRRGCAQEPLTRVSRYPRAERSGARRVPRGERSEPRGLASSVAGAERGYCAAVGKHWPRCSDSARRSEATSDAVFVEA